MNCFQFVIWRSLTHLCSVSGLTGCGCELLSICDLTIFDTPHGLSYAHHHRLWIAFNLWFDDLWHTQQRLLALCRSVVNCFQFVIWRSLTHPLSLLSKRQRCCELLSICDLTIFDTPKFSGWTSTCELWIAFNLWFDDLWHTCNGPRPRSAAVVNCFQFVIWRSLTHHRCSLMSG